MQPNKAYQRGGILVPSSAPVLARAVRETCPPAPWRFGPIVPALIVAGILAAAPGRVSAQTTRPAQATRPAAATTEPARPLPPLTGAPGLEGLPIARVEVAGNTRTEARSILNQVRTQSGQSFSNAAVEQDVRTIAAMERFQAVRADIVPTTDQRVVVRFVVTERPIVTAVEIVGNHKKTDTQIREVTSIHPGMGVDQFVMNTDIKAIEELYKKDGYAFATITVDPKPLEEHGVVRYKIEEGPRSKISGVKFDGNVGLPTSLLKWKVQTKAAFWIFRKGIVDEDKLDADVAILRDTYQGKGYIDARISYVLEYTPDKTHVVVRFVVDEGPLYHIGKIIITGNKVFSDADIRSDIIFKPGDAVVRNKAEICQRRIEDRYGHEGYINREVKILTPYTDQPAIVDLHFEITEGDAFAVGRVIVRGNPDVQDRVVRRQIRVYPDQTYDTVLVRKSVERLKATRLFGDVKVTPIGEDPGVRDALVEVQEGQSGKFLIGAGVSTNSGLVGQISLEQQNFDISNPPHSMDEFLSGQSFKGAGQYFRILLEPGTEVQRYRITFEEPYMFDSPFSFGNDAYFFTRERESWRERRIGDIVTIGRRFGDIWATSVAFRVEDVNIGNVQYYGGEPGNAVVILNANGDPIVVGNTAQEIYNQQGDHLLTSIKPGLVRDTTDSRIFPTTGTRVALAWEQYGAMGGEVSMSKITGRFDWYVPLYTDLFDRKTVFIQRNELGFIPLGNSVFYERFYAGGIGSLRAFKFRGVSPVSGVLNDPVGGDFSWLSTGEVNFPIYQEILRGVVFVDVGTVESSIELNGIRSDAGAGLRVTIPFFGQLPLAIDAGYPITKESGDRTQVISFSLGIPF